MAYQFKTKGQTLDYLKGISIDSVKVLPLMIIKRKEYVKQKQMVLEKIQKQFSEELLIIRSSSKNEDTMQTSSAGKYMTIQDVKRPNTQNLAMSIEKVFLSYDSVDEDDEVVIQPMLNNLRYSGVMFTSDIDTLAPYYIINYSEGNSGDAVTSGKTNTLTTYIVFKESQERTDNDLIDRLISICKNLETVFSNPFLDIEFGIDEKGIYIFQVRPIITEGKKDLSSVDIKDSLRKLKKKIYKLSSPHPNLLGDKAIFGVMPDWNPAEIIGLRPKKLAISLYKELITDSIWAYQRDNYGYRNLRSHPLLISFLGVPFIDVRVSFNSFIPKELNEDVAERLMNYYLNKLAKTPIYHDKVEFEIVHSCYYLDLEDRLEDLLHHGFTKEEIKSIQCNLLEMTNTIINPKTGLYKRDIEKIALLEERYNRILNSDLAIVDKIYWLSEDCKRYGTLPFAGVARASFIAVQFLKSFISLNIITKNDYDHFMNSLNTVSKNMNLDLSKVSKGLMGKDEFLKVYGHIRPGTYDILSYRYDEDFDGYFNLDKVNHIVEEDYQFTEEQLKKLDSVLIEKEIRINAKELITFIREAIEGREYTKFVFTKSLSNILRIIEEFGNKYKIEKSDLAYLDFQRIKELYATLDHRDVRDIFMTDIDKNKELFKYTEAVRLPSLIINPEDIYHFRLLHEEPNYVTLKKVTNKVITEKDIKSEKLVERIVFIESADPGYDFLFSKGIGGLVTQFGGANSHMAIRCAELGIPAVIGVGERNFKEWSQAEVIEIDGLNKQVRVIS